MGSIIQSSTLEAEELAATIRENLAGYLGFTLNDISIPAPSSNSTAHGNLQGGITSALEAWDRLITSDAQAIIDYARTIESFDSSLGEKLLGVGGEAS